MGEDRRFLIAAGTTRYPGREDLDDRPELRDEVERMVALFTAPALRHARRGLGYQAVPGFGTDLSSADLKSRLRSFLTAPDRTSDDIVVFYYTGHGEVDDSGEFILSFPDTTADVVGTGVSAGELARWLLSGTPVQRLLIVLDTCHAGVAGGTLASRAVAALGRLAGLANRPHYAIVVATRPREVATSGAFTQAMKRAVEHRASGGHEPRFLSLEDVVAVLRADPMMPASQHAQLLQGTESGAEFLPNPRYEQWLRDLDLRTQLDYQQRHQRDREFRDHVLPRAQGLDAPKDGLWLFTGRETALRDLSSWFRASAQDGVTRVVTGDPGSGKSAVLARLTVLSRPDQVRKIPRVDQLPPDTMPPLGSVDVFIHARGQTGQQVLAALCSAAGVSAERPGELLAALANRRSVFLAVIDALDEATDPDELSERILAPLMRGAPHSKLRLLLGTRRHLLERLGGPLETLNLDSERYADPVSVRAYVRRCLLDLVRDSPYRGEADDVVDGVAEAVGEAAGRSFLVALITGRSLALRKDVANPYDAHWRSALPRFAADAMRVDLDQRLGVHATKARDLLRPLAFALGSGLPWGDVWPPLASALAGTVYTNEDLDWLVREAGFYVVEALQGRQSVYRLYHEALAEHLRSTSDEAETHRRIVRFLIDRVPISAGRQDWAKADTYTKTHLVTHAVISNTLDDLLVEPAYLLHAAHEPLLAALPSAHTAQARAAAAAYRRTLKHLRKPHTDRAAYLELAAHCSRAEALVKNFDSLSMAWPWRTAWSQWARPSRESIVYGHTDDVRALAIGELDGRPVIASGSTDSTVRVWDLAVGSPIGQPLGDHLGAVRAVAIGYVDGRPVGVSSGADRVIRRWELASGKMIGQPLAGHSHYIRALAVGELDDRPVIVSGSLDNTVQVWDLTSGRALRTLATGHIGGITAIAATKSTWRPIVVSAGQDGTIRVWDLSTGSPIRRLLNHVMLPVSAMAVIEYEKRVVVVTSATSGMVQCWDLITGKPVGQAIPAQRSPTRSLAVGNVDGQLVVVTGHGDGSARRWNPHTGTQIGDAFHGHERTVHALAVSRLDDLPVLVSAGEDRTVRVWDLGDGQSAKTPLANHLNGVRAVAVGLADDRRVVVSAGDDRLIQTWDAVTGEPLGEALSGHTGSIRALATAQVGGRFIVISGGDDRTVRAWDPFDPEEREVWQYTASGSIVALSVATVGGWPIAIAGATDNSVTMLHVITGSPNQHRMVGFVYPILAVALGRSGAGITVMGTTGDDQEVWGPTASAAIFTSLEGARGDLVSTFVPINGVTTLVTGDREGTIRHWQLTKPRPRSFRLRTQPVIKMVKSIPGTNPISAIATNQAGTFAIARLYSVEITQPDEERQVIELDAEVKAMVFADSNSLLIATKQGLVALTL